MNRKKLLILPAILGLAITVPSGDAAAAFECPWTAEPEQPAVDDIQRLIPGGDPLRDVNQLDAAVDKLRQEGVKPALIIDNFVGMYCPIVATNPSLSDSEKATQVRRFAHQITDLVYTLGNETEVIVDVPLKPEIVDDVNLKAQEAGVSPQAWIAKAVTTALGAK